MTKTDRLLMRIAPEQKRRLVAHAAQHPGSVAEHARVAIDRYLDSPDDVRLVYAVVGPDGRTLRLFRERQRAETFVRELGAHLEPSGEWWYVDEDGEPSESGGIRPQEVE